MVPRFCAPARWPALPALLITGLLAAGLWRWFGAPVALPEVPEGRLQCLSYTPFTPGESGVNGPGFASAERIAVDLDLLKPYTGCVRIYSATGNGPRILKAAAERGLKVLMGVWIGSDKKQNEVEIEAALTLAREFPQATSAIVVGNEVLLRREMSGDELAAVIRRVKAASPVPVAYADVTHFVHDNPVVAAAADIVMIHILPYWDDPRPKQLDQIQAQVEETLGKLRAAFPGKEVMIGETGFPSAGRQRGPARPSRVNEARFVRVFAARAAILRVRYNLIEAIDQPWKRAPEGTVGGFWGILDQQRQLKFPLSGPVSEWPQWRAALAATLAIAAGVLLLGLRRPGLSPAGWALLSGLALALGVVLVYQWDFVSSTSQTPLGWLAGAAAAVLAVTSVIIVLPVAAGRPPQAPAPLSALTRPPTLLSSQGLRLAAFALCTTLPAAYVSLTLAFAPRYMDVPIAYFVLPAMAIALLFFAGRIHDQAGGFAAAVERREEAVLAALLICCGVAQLEWANAQTAAWGAICLLLALPWLAALGAEIRRLRQQLREPHQSQQREQHAQRGGAGGI